MMEDLQIGQIIELTDGRTATVRYVGQPHFAAGDWVGVELDDDSGKNDGSVQGERYFECEMGRGMFVRPAAVTVLEQPPPPAVLPKQVVKKQAVTAATRPKSIVGAGMGRRMSTVPDVGTGKRMSLNSASPSPVTRSRPSSLIRVCSVFMLMRLFCLCGVYVTIGLGLLVWFLCVLIILRTVAISYEIPYETAVCGAVERFDSPHWHPVNVDCAEPVEHNFQDTAWGGNNSSRVDGPAARPDYTHFETVYLWRAGAWKQGWCSNE
jgi:hypothetical protein